MQALQSDRFNAFLWFARLNGDGFVIGRCDAAEKNMFAGMYPVGPADRWHVDLSEAVSHGSTSTALRAKSRATESLASGPG